MAAASITVADVTAYGPLNLVIIQPGTFCNLNCDYCYLPGRDRQNRLDPDLIEPLFRRIFESPFVSDGFTVCWHAGEPLAVPVARYEEYFARIAAASERWNTTNAVIAQSVQTNAVPINQEWCEFFLRHSVDVGVSIDGPAFLHDAHRKTRAGAGTHAAVMRGVGLLQKNAIPFSAIAVITEASLDYPDEVFEFFTSAGITDVGFNMEETEGINGRSSLDAASVAARYAAFMERIYARTEADGGEFKVREFESIANMIYFGTRLRHTDMNRPFAILNVDYQGDFSTFDPELLGVDTERYGRFALGNVRTDSLLSACDRPAFRHMYADMHHGVERCAAECSYFGVCGGGTGSNKYWENGTFDSTETNACRLRTKIVTDIVVRALERRLLGAETTV